MARRSKQPRAWVDVADETEECEPWRRASAREKGETSIELLDLVDVIGRYPEPTGRWPGFPKRQKPTLPAH